MSKGSSDLSKIKPPAITPSKRPDKLTQAAIDDQIRSAEATRVNLENVSLAQNIEQRRQFAVRAFRFVCVWMIAVVVIVIITGFFGEGV